MQQRRAVVDNPTMQPTILLQSNPVSHALDVARRMGQRAQIDAGSRLSRDLWSVTVDAAMARGHLTVVGNLLRSELVPAVAEAMAALGEAVRLASTPPLGRPPAWSVQALPRLDRVASRLGRACEVITVAGRHAHAVEGGPPPESRELGRVARVLPQVLGDLALELEGRDAWPTVAQRLGEALCALVDPVTALVDRMDLDELEEIDGLDGLALGPLEQAIFAAYEALCGALLFALGRLDLESARPHVRARATA